MWTYGNVLRMFVILLVLQKESNAASCYQCNSKTDENCEGSEVDPKYLKTCPPSHRYCRKAVYIYYFTEPRDHFTVRECAKWGKADKECYRGRYKRDTYQLVCECKGGACNRSTFLSFHQAILLGHLIILLIAIPF